MSGLLNKRRLVFALRAAIQRLYDKRDTDAADLATELGLEGVDETKVHQLLDDMRKAVSFELQGLLAHIDDGTFDDTLAAEIKRLADADFLQEHGYPKSGEG